MAAALLPLFRHYHLPLRFTWKDYLIDYWVWLTAESAILAVCLYAIEQPRTFFRNISRRGVNIQFPWRQILSIVLPAAYFFLVFLLVLSYNDVIATARFDGSADTLLSRLDSHLLGGKSVLDLSRLAALQFPPWSVRIAELIYVGMFIQIGVTIILLGLNFGLRTATKFVSALAVAYYFALFCFLLIPATGPYYTAAGHSPFWGTHYAVVPLQEHCIFQLDLFRAGLRPEVVGADYWIALPCMHLVQPILVLWFLRSWRRVFWCLFIYDIALAISVVLLGQHYFVDLIASVPAALIAVIAVDNPIQLKARTRLLASAEIGN
jgi:hypothetical protein